MSEQTTASHAVPAPVMPPPIPSSHAPPTHRGGAVHAAPRSWPSVIGIIGLVLGILSVVMCAWGMIAPFFMGAMKAMFAGMPGGSAAMFDVQDKYKWWQVGVNALGVLVAAVLIVGSTHLMKRRRAGPIWLRTWAIVKLLVVLFEAGVMFALQQEIMAAMTAQMGAGKPPMPPGMGGFMTAAAAFGVVVTLVFYGAFPVFTLVWFSRAKIKSEVTAW